MTHLGSLGNTSRTAEAITFDYFGEEIRAVPGLSDLHYLDFLEEASGTSPDDPKSWQFIKNFAKACLDDGEFEKFWRLARKHGQTGIDVHDVLNKLIEAATGRPTEQPSDSSDGQSSTEPKSTGVSSSLAARLAGRPDLQLLVHQAQEARAS
jgi:hypothetical protein